MIQLPLPAGWTSTTDVSKLLTTMRASLPTLLSLQVADALICTFSGPDPAISTVQTAIPGALPLLLPPAATANLQAALAALAADATVPANVKALGAGLKAYLGL